MTRTIDDYLALLPAVSRDDDNFVALLTAFLQPFVDIQNTVASLPSAFDIDAAVGVQLDAVGERVGLSRRLQVPITGVYFSLDTVGVGLDQGILRGPFDPVDALTSLDDGTYRLLLKIKVLANAWDGTLEDAQAMLASIASIASSGTYLFIQDRFDMSMIIGLGGIVPSTLFVSIIKQMGDWIRPGGVALSTVYVTGKSGAPVFGLDVQNNFIGGLDSGALAVTY